MGDMADLAYDQMIDELARGEYDDRVACRYCDEQDLHWEQVAPNRWRLFDYDGVIHKCDTFEPEPTPDEKYCAEIAQMTIEQLVELAVLEYPEYLTDGYYREFGTAIRARARQLIGEWE